MSPTYTIVALLITENNNLACQAVAKTQSWRCQLSVIFIVGDNVVQEGRQNATKNDHIHQAQNNFWTPG